MFERDILRQCLALLMFVCRAIKSDYVTEDMMDMMDPSLMFAIPRLAIVWYVVKPSQCMCVCDGTPSTK